MKDDLKSAHFTTQSPLMAVVLTEQGNKSGVVSSWFNPNTGHKGKKQKKGQKRLMKLGELLAIVRLNFKSLQAGKKKKNRHTISVGREKRNYKYTSRLTTYKLQVKTIRQLQGRLPGKANKTQHAGIEPIKIGQELTKS